MSVLEKLTEGIVDRDLQKEGTALLNKWEATGLLEGLNTDKAKSSMARLLENQAKQLLKEASAMSTGDVEGFAAVAFPIVRRVFGGLIANDLVSVQPMSLPSGLIFFLDFQHTAGKLGSETDGSLFGGGKVGQQITGGVVLDDFTTATSAMPGEEGFYNLNQGYASPTASAAVRLTGVASASAAQGGGHTWTGTAAYADLGDRLIRWDPDLSGSALYAGTVAISSFDQLNRNNLVAITDTGSLGQLGTIAELDGVQIRRLTQLDPTETTGEETKILFVYAATGTVTSVALSKSVSNGGSSTAAAGEVTGQRTLTYAQFDDFGGTGAASSGNAIGVVAGQTTWGLENQTEIPEIDIKVDSVSVTAITKKLKAKWTPELGQDLNAYHNLDAEVELTGILSEQIALEIDREILNDLVVGATAGTYYWARSPGLFVRRDTGQEVGASSAAPDFTGTVSEWYETLAETINDVSAQIHRKTLRGGANFLVVSPEVANILEFTSGFRASVTADDDRGTVGTVKVGSMSKKWDVYVDPYFPRNLCLVGRKGGSFLESGYVYAPYVPLQVTPTIFGIEDFVPRKGVMTRYAKKMVRPDMYGLVVVRGLLGEAGATS